MNTSFPRAVVALLALAFILAACASDTGSQWTFAPVTASQGEESGPPTAAESGAPVAGAAATEAPVTDAVASPEAPSQASAEPVPAESATAEAPAATAEPATAAGEARIIELQANSTLQFTDTSGQPVPDIPVVPGETVVFRIENTAGFGHNFYIGTSDELQVMGGTTDVGIPDWVTGIQELEWVVPADVSSLQFACTVPGHYYTMHGTFSATDAIVAETPAEPAEPVLAEASAEPVPAESASTEVPAASNEATTAATGEARVIELEADAAIRWLQDGQQIQNIDVTPGETVLFRIDNSAGFAHNFYIGTSDELQVMGGTTDVGIPDWVTGIQELEWVVPEDISGLQFACTVPGHYYTMHGDFTVTP